MEEDENILCEAKKSFIQKLRDEAAARLKKLKDQATDPETIIASASNIAKEAMGKAKAGKSLKRKR